MSRHYMRHTALNSPHQIILQILFSQCYEKLLKSQSTLQSRTILVVAVILDEQNKKGRGNKIGGEVSFA